MKNILLTRMQYVKGIYVWMGIVYILMYLLRYINIHYLQLDLLSVNMLMIVEFSLLYVLDYQSFNINENLLKQMISLPLTRKEIWYSKFLFTFLNLIIVTFLYILLVVIFPVNLFDEIRLIAFVSLCYGIIIFSSSSFFSLHFWIITKNDLQQYLIVGLIIVIYLSSIVLLGILVYTNSIIPNKYFLVIFFGAIFFVSIYIDFFTFLKRKVYFKFFGI
jgi:hypothetical protein